MKQAQLSSSVMAYYQFGPGRWDEVGKAGVIMDFGMPKVYLFSNGIPMEYDNSGANLDLREADGFMYVDTFEEGESMAMFWVAN